MIILCQRTFLQNKFHTPSHFLYTSSISINCGHISTSINQSVGGAGLAGSLSSKNHVLNNQVEYSVCDVRIAIEFYSLQMYMLGIYHQTALSAPKGGVQSRASGSVFSTIKVPTGGCLSNPRWKGKMVFFCACSGQKKNRSSSLSFKYQYKGELNEDRIIKDVRFLYIPSKNSLVPLSHTFSANI